MTGFLAFLAAVLVGHLLSVFAIAVLDGIWKGGPN